MDRRQISGCACYSAARESVNRQLQLWRKDGILQRGRILLQNMTKLTAVARNE